MNNQCKLCQSNFVITKDREFYCSHRCQAKDAIKSANLKKTPRKKTGKIIYCKVCNKEFYVRFYRLEKVKYCSRSCLAKEHLKKYVKEFGFKSTNKPKHRYKKITINGKQYYEHRYIMEKYLGRKLEKWEHIHHKNDDSSDNRLENLEILSNADHQRKEYHYRKTISKVSSPD